MPSYLDGQEKLTQAMRNISIQIRDRIMSRLHPKHKVRIGLIGFVSPPQTAQTLSDDPIAVEDSNFTARMYSSLQPHRALPLTSSMCMATAAKIEGTVVNSVAKGDIGGAIRIATPSGVLTVSAQIKGTGLTTTVPSASVFRTQRRLFDGAVYIPD